MDPTDDHRKGHAVGEMRVPNCWGNMDAGTERSMKVGMEAEAEAEAEAAAAVVEEGEAAEAEAEAEVEAAVEAAET